MARFYGICCMLSITNQILNTMYQAGHRYVVTEPAAANAAEATFWVHFYKTEEEAINFIWHQTGSIELQTKYVLYGIQDDAVRNMALQNFAVNFYLAEKN